MRFPCLLAATCIALIALAAVTGRPTEAPRREAEKSKPPQKLPTEAEIMAAKLKYAQTLLYVITQEDFKKIEENATALVRISEGAEILTGRQTEEYSLQAKMFRQALTKMAAKAKDRNIEGVRLMYLDMTGSCFNCHDLTRKDQKKLR